MDQIKKLEQTVRQMEDAITLLTRAGQNAKDFQIQSLAIQKEALRVQTELFQNTMQFQMEWLQSQQKIVLATQGSLTITQTTTAESRMHQKVVQELLHQLNEKNQEGLEKLQVLITQSWEQRQSSADRLGELEWRQSNRVALPQDQLRFVQTFSPGTPVDRPEPNQIEHIQDSDAEDSEPAEHTQDFIDDNCGGHSQPR